jgi:hypothetical protein
MTTYNVHLYREMRLVFGGIEADSHEAAAEVARAKPTDDADEIADCDGDNIAALVDVQGDEEYGESRLIDFEPARERQAAHKLLNACRMVVDRWERGDLAEAARVCAAAVAEADSAAIIPPSGVEPLHRQSEKNDQTLKVLRGAKRLILDMGRIIRGLDENNEWLEFWTNDGDYLCCDDRYDDLATAITEAERVVEPTGSRLAKRPYSVLLLYPDCVNDTGSETYYAWVHACDPAAAIAAAQRRAVKTNEWEDMNPNAFIPLLVTEGHHYGQPVD